MPLRDDITIRPVMQISGADIRIVHSPQDSSLYLITQDGSGADTVWSNTPTLSLVDVEDLTSQKQHSRPTSARMLWDDDHLYFLFTMVDLHQPGRPLYQEEVVEVFIDPDGDGLNYAEIEVNPLNTVFDLLLSRPWADSGSGFAQWNPEFASAVGIDGTLNDGTDEDVSWTVEIACPGWHWPRTFAM